MRPLEKFLTFKGSWLQRSGHSRNHVSQLKDMWGTEEEESAQDSCTLSAYKWTCICWPPIIYQVLCWHLGRYSVKKKDQSQLHERVTCPVPKATGLGEPYAWFNVPSLS